MVHEIQDGFSLTPLIPPTSPIANIFPPSPASKTVGNTNNINGSSPPEIVAAMTLDEFFRVSKKSGISNNFSKRSNRKRRKKRKFQGPIAERWQMTIPRATQTIIHNHFGKMGTISPLDWHVIVDPTRIGNYDHNYLDRASIAMEVLGANLPADSVYPYTSVDIAGSRLNSKNNYSVKFVGGEPPCNAFWSLTLYNDQNYLVENFAKKYSIANLPAKQSPSVKTIIISRTPPVDKEGKESLENWLPSGNPDATPENFNLILRIYWPLSSVLESRWLYPTVVKT